MYNILIADNVVYTDTYHGVAMYYPINVTITGNTLVTVNMSDNKIWILLVSRERGERRGEKTRKRFLLAFVNTARR